MRLIQKLAAAALLLSAAATAQAKLADPLVTRTPEGPLSISWASDGPVDVYVSNLPVAKISAA